MRKFTDATGHDWILEATRDSLRRVKDLAGVDLLTGEGLARVTDSTDLWTLLELWPEVLHALCLPQCQGANVSAEGFAQILLAEHERPDAPPTFDAAITAALEEIGSFFRRLGRRTAATAIEQIVQTRTIKETELSRRATGAIQAAIDRELEATVQSLETDLNQSQISPPGT